MGQRPPNRVPRLDLDDDGLPRRAVADQRLRWHADRLRRGYLRHLGRALPARLAAGAGFGFEDGTSEGWSVKWGTTLTVSNEQSLVWTGSHALALDLSGRGQPAVGVDSELQGLRPGSVVSYHVWAPTGAPVTITPALTALNWHVTLLGPATLAPGWNALNFTVPDTLSTIRVLGLQVDDRRGWKGRLALDDVSWSG